MGNGKRWWQKTTIYHIYPRSYKDSNNDGIGDIQGIISKLDYIKGLGFETIWISPFFTSPKQDWGYDISDYLDIDPEYGELNDVEELIQQVHHREMRILFDLVLNHTSDLHPWFLESRSSWENPKRDWYIWRDGRGSSPPNNWKSIIGGSGWHFDQGSGQWYYASFLPFQPDLNYRNPEVIQEIFNITKYWLDKGVDGFRLDIFHAIFKDRQFRDNPFSIRLFPNDFFAGYFQKWKYNLNQPETIDLAINLRKLVNTYSPERMLIGEIYGDDATIRRYTGETNDGLNLVFLWDLIDFEPNADYLRKVIRKYEHLYPEPATPVYVFGSHDHRRLMSRIGDNKRIASLLALFQLTTRGVPVTYYGEEIGMSEGKFKNFTPKDPIGKKFQWIPQFLLDWLHLYVNRDGCRTPMQWDDNDNAGFTDFAATPWLPINKNYREINVNHEIEEIGSLMMIYRELLHLRQEKEALREGTLELIEPPEIPKHLLGFQRRHNNQFVLILINFGDMEGVFTRIAGSKWVLFQIGGYQRSEKGNIILSPKSGVILTG